MRWECGGMRATYGFEAVVGDVVGRGLVVLGRGLGNLCNKNAWQSVYTVKKYAFLGGGANSAAGCDGMRREG